MVLPLSQRAKDLLNATNINGQIIIEIDGFEEIAIFGAIDVTRFARLGEDELTIGDFFIGGVVVDEHSKALISLDGTDKVITEQIIPDNGGTSSIQKINIKFVDVDDELSNLFSPGQVVPDLHGTKARVYVGFDQGSHREDSVLILAGIIKETKFGAGYVKLSIAHPEELKRQDLFTKFEGELLVPISNSLTTIPLVSVEGLLYPEDILRTFVVINDEIIEYTGINPGTNSLIGCIRGADDLDGDPTIAASHEQGDGVESLYVLEEETIPLALKLMVSGPEEFFAEDVEVQHFLYLDFSNSLDNAIVFKDPDIVGRYGLTPGDTIITTGASNGSNNVTRQIIGSGVYDGGSYIIVNGAALVEEQDTSAVIKFKSQYRTMTQIGTGCNISPESIDVEYFQFWEETFGPTYPNYRFGLYDSINAKEFIDTQIMWPASLYTVPRKGRISMQMSIPPLALEGVIRINDSNVLNPNKLEVARSVNQYFWNTVEYSYNYDPIEGDGYRRYIRISQDSLDRIKVGVKKLFIDSQGLRQDLDALNIIETTSRRLIDRYKFGAQLIKGIQLNYSTGMPLEVSDQVVLEGASLKLVDTKRGDRNFESRLFEIIRKRWDYVTGSVIIDLLDTGFSIDFRIGLMGPSSWIEAGSSTTEIRIKRSFGTTEDEFEVEKWREYVGQPIKIRDDEYNFLEEVTLVEIPFNRKDTLIIDPPLSITPPEDYLVDMPDYSGDSTVKDIWKNVHCFMCPVVDVVSGVSNTQFTVAPADIGKFFVGGFVRVHDPTFDIRNSERLEIVDVDGGTNTITVEDDLGFTPQAGDEARPIGFVSDNGKPYNYI
jgi:hypothetical protein